MKTRELFESKLSDKQKSHVKTVASGTGELTDEEYDAVFQYYAFDADADDRMPYGTAKARSGDPYQWVNDKLNSLSSKELTKLLSEL